MGKGGGRGLGRSSASEHLTVIASPVMVGACVRCTCGDCGLAAAAERLVRNLRAYAVEVRSFGLCAQLHCTRAESRVLLGCVYPSAALRYGSAAIKVEVCSELWLSLFARSSRVLGHKVPARVSRLGQPTNICLVRDCAHAAVGG